MMAIRGKSNKEKHGIKCQRCKGWMAFEKFYGLNDVFFGWHCVMCGNIIDPVILLHRISQDAEIAIPGEFSEVMTMASFTFSGPKGPPRYGISPDRPKIGQKSA
jgi:hypothetical protein